MNFTNLKNFTNYKEMDKLELYISENRDSFDMYEPSAEVWNKVKKIEKQPKVVKLQINSYLWKVAAAIVLFMGGYYFQYLIQKSSGPANQMNLGGRDNAYTIQVAETETYYTKLVDSKLVEIQGFSKQFPDLLKDTKNELSQLDSVYSDLKTELKQNINKQEIINAMIQNYRLKLQILEEILTDLNNKNANIKTDEKNQYKL